MSLIVSEGNGGHYEPHPEGQYAARCIDVIDFGMVETRYGKKHRGGIVFWCGERGDEDKLLTTSAFFTLSLYETSNLRGFLERWRGKPFTPEELKGFDLETLIGVNAFIQITHNVTPAKTYANIDTIMKLPKGTDPVPVPEDYVRYADRQAENSTEPEPAHAGADDPGDDLPF